MKKLKTGINGGMPLVQDDLGMIQDAIESAVGTGLSINGEDTYFIKPPVQTAVSGLLSFTAGIAVVGGKLYETNAVSGINVFTTPHIYLELVTTFDPAGLKVFATGGAAINTWQIDKMTITAYSTVQVGKLEYYGIPNFSQIIASIVEDSRNIFTRTQSWGKGGDAVLTTGNLALDSNGNSYNVTIAAASILNFIQITPGTSEEGAIIILKFIGTTGYQVTVNNTATLITPGGIPYVYKAGDFALFRKVSAGYELIEKAPEAVVAPLNPIMAAGSYAHGDVGAGGVSATINIGSTLSTSNYYIVASIANSGTPVDNASFWWTITNRTTTTFTVFFNEGFAASQAFTFEWVLFKK